jgi:hypothetical protein
MKLDIKQFCPCDEGLDYYESKASFEGFWSDCERGDWMLWMAARLKIDDRTLTRAKALCANTVRHLMKDPRSAAAVDAALRYADGEISREELNVYASAVAIVAAYAHTAYAAYAAADDTNAATVAACAAYAVAANDDAYTNAARDANRRQTADICRQVLTEAVFEIVKQTQTI